MYSYIKKNNKCYSAKIKEKSLTIINKVICVCENYEICQLYGSSFIICFDYSNENNLLHSYTVYAICLHMNCSQNYISHPYTCIFIHVLRPFWRCSYSITTTTPKPPPPPSTHCFSNGTVAWIQYLISMP